MTNVDLIVAYDDSSEVTAQLEELHTDGDLDELHKLATNLLGDLELCKQRLAVAYARLDRLTATTTEE